MAKEVGRKPMSREERLKQHTERIALGETVERIKEKVDTGLEVPELKRSIDGVREQMALIKLKLSVVEDPKLQKLRDSLADRLTVLKKEMRRYAGMVSDMITQDMQMSERRMSLHRQLKSLKEKRKKVSRDYKRHLEELTREKRPIETAVKEAVEALKGYCEELGIDSEMFLEEVHKMECPELGTKRIVKVEGETPKKLTETLFPKKVMTWKKWKEFWAKRGLKVTRDTSGMEPGRRLPGDEAKAALGKTDKMISKELLV